MIPLPVTRIKIWKGPLHGTYAIISGELPKVLPGLPEGQKYRLRESMSGLPGYVYSDTSKMRDGVSGVNKLRKRNYELLEKSWISKN